MKLIHDLADVQSEKIGEGTRSWQFCVALTRVIVTIGSEHVVA